MLTRETIKAIKIKFAREAKLKENIAWNITEILSLKASAPTNQESEKAININDRIYYGETLVAEQKKELKSLSISEIARKMGVPRQTVHRYKSVYGY